MPHTTGMLPRSRPPSSYQQPANNAPTIAEGMTPGMPAGGVMPGMPMPPGMYVPPGTPMAPGHMVPGTHGMPNPYAVPGTHGMPNPYIMPGTGVPGTHGLQPATGYPPGTGVPGYVPQAMGSFQLQPGMVLGGRYSIIKHLGTGGMGEVFRAADLELDNAPVAIKVLPPIFAGNPRAVAGLKREARIALLLTHENICRLHTFRSDGDVKYLVMEFVDGATFQEVLEGERDGKMAWDRLYPLARQFGAALDYAHSLNPPVLHRDIKPTNMMVTRDGRAKLLDFGIAREMRNTMTRLTGKEDTAGTLPYMSPEQFRGEHLDTRSDLYSFCLVLYEGLSGMPFVSSGGSLAWQVQEKPFQPLAGVPEEANRLLAAGLAKNRDHRPKSFAALLEGEHVSASETPKELKLDLGDEVSLDLVLVSPATFAMGSPEAERRRNSDETLHQVTLTRPLYLGKFPVTQQQYDHIMGEGPSYFEQPQNPVENVSWENALQFCLKLASRLGKPIRLPTEAEWEYACRAGSTTAFCFGDSNYNLGDYAWYAANSESRPHPVGQKKPNPWGLYDMHGNVWEWCSDWYGPYPVSLVTDPLGGKEGTARVLRGGAWNLDPRSCRSADRGRNAPTYRAFNLGFRICVDLG